MLPPGGVHLLASFNVSLTFRRGTVCLTVQLSAIVQTHWELRQLKSKCALSLSSHCPSRTFSRFQTHSPKLCLTIADDISTKRNKCIDQYSLISIDDCEQIPSDMLFYFFSVKPVHHHSSRSKLSACVNKILTVATHRSGSETVIPPV